MFTCGPVGRVDASVCGLNTVQKEEIQCKLIDSRMIFQKYKKGKWLQVSVTRIKNSPNPPLMSQKSCFSNYLKNAQICKKIIHESISKISQSALTGGVRPLTSFSKQISSGDH